MDLRRHRRSEVSKPDTTLSIERFAHDVQEMMDSVRAQQAHVVGNADGGCLAQRLAITKPAPVLGLALIGSTSGLSPSATEWLPLIETEGLIPFLVRTIAMRFDVERTDHGMIRCFLAKSPENDPARIARCIGGTATQEWSADLPRIAARTLVIHPGGETVGSANSYETMGACIPDVKTIEHLHMPHNIADMMADRSVTDIVAFLSAKLGHPKAAR
jgi:pimeloyl-ACP methyl ester carboxylesterase